MDPGEGPGRLSQQRPEAQVALWGQALGLPLSVWAEGWSRGARIQGGWTRCGPWAGCAGAGWGGWRVQLYKPLV